METTRSSDRGSLGNQCFLPPFICPIYCAEAEYLQWTMTLSISSIYLLIDQASCGMFSATSCVWPTALWKLHHVIRIGNCPLMNSKSWFIKCGSQWLPGRILWKSERQRETRTRSSKVKSLTDESEPCWGFTDQQLCEVNVSRSEKLKHDFYTSSSSCSLHSLRGASVRGDLWCKCGATASITKKGSQH